MPALCWTLKETLMVFAIAFCGLASMFPNRAVEAGKGSVILSPFSTI